MSKEGGMKFWGWFLQRITGFILLLLLGIHIYLSYFAASGTVITHALVQERIRSSVLLVDLLLLYIGLYHGLYGLRQVVADLMPQCKSAACTAVFIVSGVGLSILGTSTLMTILK